jgi:hypothetical protein
LLFALLSFHLNNQKSTLYTVISVPIPRQLKKLAASNHTGSLLRKPVRQLPCAKNWQKYRASWQCFMFRCCKIVILCGFLTQFSPFLAQCACSPQCENHVCDELLFVQNMA